MHVAGICRWPLRPTMPRIQCCIIVKARYPHSYTCACSVQGTETQEKGVDIFSSSNSPRRPCSPRQRGIYISLSCPRGKLLNRCPAEVARQNVDDDGLLLRLAPLLRLGCGGDLLERNRLDDCLVRPGLRLFADRLKDPKRPNVLGGEP